MNNLIFTIYPDIKMQIRPVQEWLPERQAYLDKLLHHEGLSDADNNPLCAGCGTNTGVIKCQDCFGGQLCCADCVLQGHALLPLHRLLVSLCSFRIPCLPLMLVLQCWSGSFFAPTSLYSLGHRVYLGHEGKPCPNTRSVADSFTVVNTSGIHTVKVVFCCCAGLPKPHVQLLCVQWFPATMHSPHTAFTFDILNTFLLLNLQGKISLFDYYYAVHHKSDNTGTQELKVGFDSRSVIH